MNKERYTIINRKEIYNQSNDLDEVYKKLVHMIINTGYHYGVYVIHDNELNKNLDCSSEDEYLEKHMFDAESEIDSFFLNPAVVVDGGQDE